MRYSLFILIMILITLSTMGCQTPTLQQRQDTWRKYRTGVQDTCKVGRFDPAMPDDVKGWCVGVVAK